MESIFFISLVIQKNTHFPVQNVVKLTFAGAFRMMLCVPPTFASIGGFHVTSYQANFASHPTRDRHVGFLLHGRVLENTTKCLVTFYLVHITIPNYDRVTRI